MSDNKVMTLALNDFLTDITGAKQRVSEILSDFGMEQNHINDIRDENLEAFHESLKFALECRLLHYSDGSRLFDIICRTYGLFGVRKETIKEISDSLNENSDHIRKLHKKAIRRVRGRASSGITDVLILLCACQTLKLDAKNYLGRHKIYSANLTGTNNNTFINNSAHANGDDSMLLNEQTTLKHLPKTTFHISGRFDYTTKRGMYSMIIEHIEHKRYIEKQDLEGHSDVNMILLALIEGIKTLQQPYNITVYSNTLFGITSIFRKGVPRQEISSMASNYELKYKILQMVKEYGHSITNIAEKGIKNKLIAWKNDRSSFG